MKNTKNTGTIFIANKNNNLLSLKLNLVFNLLLKNNIIELKNTIFSLDNINNYLETLVNKVSAKYSINSIKSIPDNTIENTTKISFDDQNSLIFKTRRNRKISLTEYYDLVYEYQNDCLTAGIKYRKTYYQDRDLKPKEDLFFTITLFPLTTLDQKIDQQLYR